MSDYWVEYYTKETGQEHAIVIAIDEKTAFECICDKLAEYIASGEVDIATIKIL